MRPIDPLERRALLSAMIDPDTGLLTVNGTDAGEAIEVEIFYGATADQNQVRTRVGATAKVLTGNPLALPGRVFVNAGPGDDSVRVFVSGSIPSYRDPILVEVYGGAGNDSLSVEFADNTTLAGGAGDDTLLGSFAPDSLDGGAGNDELAGHEGNDTLHGGDGDDSLYGNEGDDTLEGNAGNDSLRGQQDNDSLLGGEGDDLLDGDRGYDTASYYEDTNDHHSNLRISIGDGPNDGSVLTGEHDDVTGETENITGSTGDDTLIGDEGANVLRGRGGGDLLVGNGGQDRLEGGEFSQTLLGGRGNDTLIGYDAKDFLYGERGDDVLDGGAARDHCDGGPGRDTINEGFYQSNTGDVLTLAGTLRYFNGIAGPDWKLQSGTTGVNDDLLNLDVSAVQSRADALIDHPVTVTGHAEWQFDDNEQITLRVFIVQTLTRAPLSRAPRPTT